MRVRFAPSPTGHLHVGNARTALYNWLLARGHGGTLVLRIEDTDAGRSTRDSEAGILDDLRWLGLTWDEGVGAGGPLGPYRQSERQDIYRARTDWLLAAGHAYRCFCSVETLDADRQRQLAAGLPPRYAGTCRSLDPDEAAARHAAGEAAAIRLRVPERRAVVFDDIVRGRVTVQTDVIGDPVLVRSDGLPAYNYAVVVDDHLMEITHVIRGEDHISNTPRQLLLYEAFGWQPPQFAHLSLVLGPDHAPLSKRHGATSVAEFRARGYLPEALVNYLALIGWSPRRGGADGVAADGTDLLPLAELARRFRLEDVSHSAGVFDESKLAWVNRHYLKALPAERLVDEALPFLRAAGMVIGDPGDGARAWLAGALAPAASSVDRLEQIPDRLRPVFDFDVDTLMADPELRDELSGAEGRRLVGALAEALAAAPPLRDRVAFRAVAAQLRDRTGLRGRALLHPIRIVLTGRPEGPELDVIVPAIDGAAALPPQSGLATVVSCADRAARVRRRLAA